MLVRRCLKPPHLFFDVTAGCFETFSKTENSTGTLTSHGERPGVQRWESMQGFKVSLKCFFFPFLHYLDNCFNWVKLQAFQETSPKCLSMMAGLAIKDSWRLLGTKLISSVPWSYNGSESNHSKRSSAYKEKWPQGSKMDSLPVCLAGLRQLTAGGGMLWLPPPPPRGP